MQELTIKTSKSIGRPCKYETHVKPYLDQILQWLKDGMNEYSIQDKLGVSKDAWIRYKSDNQELKDLYRRACEERNNLVQNAVFAGSLGHTAIVKKQKVLQNGTVVDFQEEEYIAPDMNAAKFWLINRDPENWKDKQANDTSISVNFQLPDFKSRITQLRNEEQRPQSLEVTDFEVLPEGKT